MAISKLIGLIFFVVFAASSALYQMFPQAAPTYETCFLDVLRDDVLVSGIEGVGETMPVVYIENALFYYQGNIAHAAGSGLGAQSGLYEITRTGNANYIRPVNSATDHQYPPSPVVFPACSKEAQPGDLPRAAGSK